MAGTWSFTITASPILIVITVHFCNTPEAASLLIHWGEQAAWVFPNEPHHHFLDIDVKTVVGVY